MYFVVSRVPQVKQVGGSSLTIRFMSCVSFVCHVVMFSNFKLFIKHFIFFVNIHSIISDDLLSVSLKESVLSAIKYIDSRMYS